MNMLNKFLPCLPVALALTGLPAVAGDDAALDAVVGELRHAVSARPAWENPLLPEAAGIEVAVAADVILQARLSEYTRELFDRGGWVNPHVASPGYDLGNPLLAVLPSEGLSSGGIQLASALGH